MEQYQDLWCQGNVMMRGVRGCEERFNIIRDFLAPSPPQTVMDLGANLGYFSMRLAEQFDCRTVAIETHYSRELKDALEANGDSRVEAFPATIEYFLNQKHARYDVVLALSVVHHLSMPYTETLDLLRAHGRTVIVELATELGACGQHRIVEQYVPENAIMLGNVESHLGAFRPMFALR